MQRQDRNDPGDVKKLFVKSGSGEMVSLDNLLTFSESASPAAIYRFNRAVSATIQGTPAPGKTLGDGIEELDRIAEKVLPENFRTSLAGQSRDFAESSSSLLFAFMLALLIIYLVLAAQFESFRDPFIIILTVPLSVAGALISLWATDQTLNVFSQIGIIMLIGIVTKNGILIVEFANQRKEAGLSKVEAVLDASVSRFRPIMMTSLATIAGILMVSVVFVGTWGAVQWIPLWIGDLAGPDNPRAKALAMVIVSVGACASTFIAPLVLAGLRRRLGYQLLCLFALLATVWIYRTPADWSGAKLFDIFPWVMALKVFTLGMAATAFFGFFPLYLPELFPTRVRATGQGICYNTGRLVAVPFVLLSGKLVATLGGYQQAAAAITLVYGVGLFVAFLGKETSGQALQD